MYDIFFVGTEGWLDFNSKYPNAQRVSKDITYHDLNKKSFTKMFWVVWDDLILKDFSLNNYRTTEWDNQYIHIFKNGKTYDGICLFPKNLKITDTEFNTRDFKEKKEVKIQASIPKKYDIFNISNYNDYEQALDKTTTEMFWMIPNDVEMLSSFKFDYYVPKYDTYHRNLTHVFLNNQFHDGVALLSKNKTVTEKEIKHRFFVNKKEVKIQASIPKKYDIFNISNYNDYEQALDKTTTEMFWAIWPEIEITDNIVLDTYYSHHDAYNRNENHVFKNLRNNDATYVNGVVLFSKNNKVTAREIKYRYLINKKEHNKVVSEHKKYDIVFVSYEEPNAETNFKALQRRFPNIKRVHGVEGIHQAHIAAAKLCDTEMFWVVDGDAEVYKDFDFSYVVNRYELQTVHVWRSKNPVNDLVYGYGGIKLLPTLLTINMDTSKTDMTTSISDKFKAMEEISNITAFDTDPFNTWKSAFRECAKLASKSIDRQNEEETDERLETWTTVGHDRPFGEYAIRGAKAGMEFGISNKSDISLINDFRWLKKTFDSEFINE